MTAPARRTGPSPRVRGIRISRPVPAGVDGSIPARAGNPTVTVAASVPERVHPRACGESDTPFNGGSDTPGPSPRVRGIPQDVPRRRLRQRSIPARAGNPWRTGPAGGSSAVHPRACGESEPPRRHGRRAGGPSPRVRGIRATPCRCSAAIGSIPARAGNPRRPAGPRIAGRVHPRACGESVVGHEMTMRSDGPSPRVRGIRQPRVARGQPRGSIPARAGNPAGGGDSAGGFPGPSPRVRGIQDAQAPRALRGGSIPARAGNPRAPSRRPAGRRVHPRACGESATRRSRRAAASGPSPRVRGIPDPESWRYELHGSIPARAGNPRRRPPRRPHSAVHPRACGESSGPVRPEHSRLGSIPARAGNPFALDLADRIARVHPRACGESIRGDDGRAAALGPSPRVRGIRWRRRGERETKRSIPARAGNPRAVGREGVAVRVHPRACGESILRPGVYVQDSGPSPRVRGIRRRAAAERPDVGSIPARAGNPPPHARRGHRSRVHPRACGESGPRARRRRSRAGPSPRVRGIPLRARVVDIEVGSIPARAGNPAGPSTTGCRPTVHPRACGESAGGGGARRRGPGPSPRVRGIRPPSTSRGRERGSIPARAGNPASGRG